MADWREQCSAPLDVPTARPDDGPLVYVPLSRAWADLFIDICAILEDGEIWADEDPLGDGYTGAQIAADAFLKAETLQTAIVGEIKMWLMNTPPDRWLICDGTQVSKTTYPELFALIGYTWGGAGDLFGLPSYVGYSPMGAGGLLPVRGFAGTQMQTLNISQLPYHNHPVNDPGHSHAVTDPGHTHRERVGNGANAFVLGVSGGSNTYIQGGVTTNTAVLETGSKATGITVNSGATGITTGDTGSGQPFSVVHPVVGTHFIIYAGGA